MGVFIAYPWAALIAAACFASLWLRRRRSIVLLASILWVAYAGYEWLMYARILCTGECNIRVDLLLIYPALLAISLVAVAAGFRGISR